MTEAVQQDRLSDWLALHGLSAATCLALLDAALPQTDTAVSDRGPPPVDLLSSLSASDAWAKVSEAVASILPDVAPRVLQQCGTCFDPPQGRSFTLHDGGNGVPLVACVWSGRPHDLLTMAHEFGHAAQIMASPPGMAMTPVMRETCAFLAEAALVSHLQAGPAKDLAAVLQSLWQAETLRLLGRSARTLRQALSHPDAAYDYGWNYPIARRLALRLWQDQRAAIPALFAGGLTLSQVLGHFATEDRNLRVPQR